MTDTQPRTPAGSPAGGQFGVKSGGAESQLAIAIDPFADAKIGDPDTTPDFNNEDCGATAPSGCCCTREAGHDGRHVAGNTEQVVDVWDDAPRGTHMALEAGSSRNGADPILPKELLEAMGHSDDPDCTTCRTVADFLAQVTTATPESVAEGFRELAELEKASVLRDLAGTLIVNEDGSTVGVVSTGAMDNRLDLVFETPHVTAPRPAFLVGHPDVRIEYGDGGAFTVSADFAQSGLIVTTYEEEGEGTFVEVEDYQGGDITLDASGWTRGHVGQSTPFAKWTDHDKEQLHNWATAVHVRAAHLESAGRYASLNLHRPRLVSQIADLMTPKAQS